MKTFLHEIKKMVLLAAVLLGFAATGWGQTAVYTLDLGEEGNATAFTPNTGYGAKTGTVNGVAWNISMANYATSGGDLGVQMGWNTTYRANALLSAATRSAAIAAALGVATSAADYSALVGTNDISSVGKITVAPGSTSVGTANASIWCLYTTDNGASYEVLGTFSKIDKDVQTFTATAAIANAQYAFVWKATVGTFTYRAPVITFYTFKAPDPKVSLSTSTLDFGEVKDDAEKEETFTLTPSALTGNLSLSLKHGDHFSVDSSSIAQSTTEERTITVTFAPTAVGEYKDTLVISGGGIKDTMVALSGVGISAATPELEVVSPESRLISFEDVELGSYATQTVKLHLNSIENPESAISFELADTAATPVFTKSAFNAVDSTVDITFTPTAIGSYGAKLYLSYNGLKDSVKLSGRGDTAYLRVDDSVQVRMGSVAKDESKTVTLRVYAMFLRGDVTLVLSGDDANMFSLDSTTFVKPDNGRLSYKPVKVTYTPTEMGSHSATLTVKCEDMPAIVIPLSGLCSHEQIAGWTFEGKTVFADNGANANIGMAATTTAATDVNYNQGTGGLGTFCISTNDWAMDKYWQVKVAIKGYENILVSSKQGASATGPKDFKLQYSVDGSTFSDVPDGIVEVGNNWTLGVVENLALPSACNGQDTVWVRWVVNSTTTVNGGTLASGGTSRIDDIIFTATPSPSLTVNPASLNFSNVELESTSTAQTLTVSGEALKDDISYTKGGDDADAFTVEEAEWSAATGGTLSLSFKPTEQRAYSATLTISSTGAADKVVALSGKGVVAGTPILGVTPDSIGFGVLFAGGTSGAKIVVLDTSSLDGSTITYTLSNATDFTIDEETLSLSFTPKSAGAKSAMLYVECAAKSLRDSVKLTGTGVVPTLSVDSAQVRAGAVMLTKGKKITLSVSAQHLTDKVALTIDGANADMFTIDSVTLALPADSTLDDKVVVLTYEPTAIGQHTARLTLSSAGAEPVIVELSGEGVEYIFVEDFENLTTGSVAYDGAAASFETGEWFVKGHRVNDDDRDRKNGVYSVRLRGNTSDGDHRAEMNFNKPNGVGTVTFSYGSYGAHSGGRLQVQFSTDDGATWRNRGSEIVAPAWSGSMLTATVKVYKVAPVRIRILKQSQSGNTSVNIDDITVTDCLTAVPLLDVSGSAAFGYHKAGVSSQPQVFTVTGEDLTSAISYEKSGADTAAFILTEDAAWTAANGGKLNVSFAPTEAREYSATLTVRSAGADEVVLNLTGTGMSLTPISSISSATTSEYENKTVLTAGVVTAITSNKKSCFIQSGSGALSGLYVYRTAGASNLTVAVGDSVQFIGSVIYYHGLLELSVTNDDHIVKVDEGHATPAPVVITAAELGKEYQGVLITINGVAAEGTTLSDGTAEVKAATGIYAANFDAANTYNVTGVGYWDNGAQLAPRSTDDIEKLLSSDATLSSLAVSEGTLTPAFNPDSTRYTVNVPYSVTLITFTATATHSAAGISGNEEEALNVGENIFSVVVTAEDGVTQKTYTVTVTREEEQVTAVVDHELQLLTLYPNPVANTLYVDAPLQVVKVEVISAGGVLLMQVENQAELNVAQLPSGLYVVRVTFADGRTAAKLITK